MKKKIIMLLILLPLYLFFRYLLAFFNQVKIDWSDCFGMGIFLVAAVLVLVLGSGLIRLNVLIIFHIVAFTVLMLLQRHIPVQWQDLAVYVVFALPALLLIAREREKETKNVSKKAAAHAAGKGNAQARVLFAITLFGGVLVPTIAVLGGSESIKAVFDSVAICWCIVCAMLFVSWYVLHKNQSKRTALIYAVLPKAGIWSACACLVYVLWANQYVEDKMFLFFPLGLVLSENLPLLKSTTPDKKEKARNH